MDRRGFLTALGSVTAAGLVLPACGLVGRGGSGIPDGQPGLVLRQPSYELLTGEQRRYAFLLVDPDNRPVEADQVDLYVADEQGDVLGGPYEAVHHDEGQDRLGTFRTHIDLPRAGIHTLIAVHGREKGEGAVNVVDPDSSAFPAPGDPAVPAPTPTTADDQGYSYLCTAEPDCGMHDSSLEAALEAGRPVMLLFATPAYCQMAVCAPAVSTADEVRTEQDWGDLAWIHAEIFTDAGDTVAPVVSDWNLPSEPWLYAIGGDGTIAERCDGPIVRADLRDLARLIS